MAKLIIESRYGIIPNNLLNNSKISWKAKGIFGYIQSKNDDWDFSIQRVSNDTKDGIDSTRGGIQELEEHGYLIRRNIRLPNGTWDNEWTLYSEPYHTGKTNTATASENPTSENPTSENPTSENPTSNKERNTKQEIVINKEKEILNDSEDFQEKNNRKKGSIKERKEIIIDFDDKELQKTWEDFQDYRKEIKKAITDQGRKNLLKKLNQYTPETATKMLEESMINGWQGVFELKGESERSKKMQQIANYNFT